MYLLDTNIVSYWMRGDEAIIGRLKDCSPADLSMSSITLAEIYYGIEKSPLKKEQRRYKIRKIFELLELFVFDENSAAAYGWIRTELERKGMMISERDTQIASIGFAHDLIVVTHNVKEFGRVKGLQVEDWAV